MADEACHGLGLAVRDNHGLRIIFPVLDLGMGIGLTYTDRQRVTNLELRSTKPIYQIRARFV